MLGSLINPSCIKLDLKSSEYEECFAELLEVIIANHHDVDRTEAMNALVQREEKMSTAIFPCVAVPHAVCDIKNIAIAIGVSRDGVTFDAIEDNGKKSGADVDINIVFEILFAEHDTEIHLQVLRDILELINNPDFVKNVVNSKSSQEVYDLIISIVS